MADPPRSPEVLPALPGTRALPRPPRRPSDRALGRVDTLSAYMAELAHHAPINREEEQRLALRWVEQRDVEAARQLVLANLRLVVKIAMEYRRAWVNVLDLIQSGNVGLMEAVQRFDPYQGVKLSTYAAYWIRAYILKYILDNFRIVRLGTTRAQRKLFFRLNKEKRELERQGFEVEPRLLAERLDVSEADVVDMDQRLSRGRPLAERAGASRRAEPRRVRRLHLGPRALGRAERRRRGAASRLPRQGARVRRGPRRARPQAGRGARAGRGAEDAGGARRASSASRASASASWRRAS